MKLVNGYKDGIEALENRRRYVVPETGDDVNRIDHSLPVLNGSAEGSGELRNIPSERWPCYINYNGDLESGTVLVLRTKSSRSDQELLKIIDDGLAKAVMKVPIQDNSGRDALPRDATIELGTPFDKDRW